MNKNFYLIFDSARNLEKRESVRSQSAFIYIYLFLFSSILSFYLLEFDGYFFSIKLGKSESTTLTPCLFSLLEKLDCKPFTKQHGLLSVAAIVDTCKIPTKGNIMSQLV